MHLRLPGKGLLRATATPLVVAGTLAAVGPAAVAAATQPAASCGHKVVQPFGLNALTDPHASALAKLTPRRGCGTAALPGVPGSTAASPKAASPKAAVPGATTPGTVPGIPEPRSFDPAAASRKALSPNSIGSNAINPRADIAKTNMISAVDATSASDAWAVGSTTGSTGGTPLIEHWDGSTSDGLSSVTATSATNAWAVGISNDGTGDKLLVERWNGTAWTIVSVPSPAGSSLEFNSVKATSATNAWAIGQYQDTTGITRPLAEHWDGKLPTPASAGSTQLPPRRRPTCGRPASPSTAAGQTGRSSSTGTGPAGPSPLCPTPARSAS